MKALLIKDITKEERESIVHQALQDSCRTDCKFCSGCDNRGCGVLRESVRIILTGTALSREAYDAARVKTYKGLFSMRRFSEKNSITETETCRFFAKTRQYIN